MKIHTYYEEIFDAFDKDNSQKKLLSIWQESWQKQGWECVILNRESAKENPKYDEYVNRFNQYKTVNNKDYELACFLRWVAMEQVGDGFMCDYDVMNYGFNAHREGDFMLYSKNVVPCVVWATKKGWSYVLDKFMNYQHEGKNHISDQNILVDLADKIMMNKKYMCTEYKEEGNWYEYPLVHYPYSRMDEQGLFPRWKYVREFNDIISNLNVK